MYLCLFVCLPIYLFFFSQHGCLGAKNQLLLSLCVPSEKPLQLSCKHRVPGSSILLDNVREERDGDGGGRGDTHHFPLPLAPSFVSTQVGHAVPVPAGSPSRGGDVTVYVQDTNQPSLPALFFYVLFLCLFLSYGPFNCIPFHTILPTTLRFLTRFFRSSLCLTGPFNYMSLSESLL